MPHCSPECWNPESLTEHWMICWKLNGSLNIEYALNTGDERKCTIVSRTTCLIPKSIETSNHPLIIEWFAEYWMCIEHWTVHWILNMHWTLKGLVNIEYALNIKWFIKHWMVRWTLNMHWTWEMRENAPLFPGLIPRSVETLNQPLNIEWFDEYLNMHWTSNGSLNIKSSTECWICVEYYLNHWSELRFVHEMNRKSVLNIATHGLP